MILSVNEIIGHFHPVLVHLPIGVLLLAVLFQFLSRKEKYKNLSSATGKALFYGMLSAIASCISGYLLSNTESYDAQTVSRHQWLGITTTVVAITAYYLHKKNKSYLQWVMLLLGILIIITGHFGGSLTHGSNYVFNTSNTPSRPKTKPIANAQEAVLYSDIIQPILQNKCYSCHAQNKQKGNLRLDEQKFILTGGKNGAVLLSGNANESEMIKRILLAVENEDHMPPKEKPQLTSHEINLLHWWVSSGANFDKKVKEISQPEKINIALQQLQSGGTNEEAKASDIPQKQINKANDSALARLKSLGVIVTPVAQKNNYLSANFITADFTTKNIQLLEPIKEQLIWLKLGNTKISDSAMQTVAKLTNLTKLYLENTVISDAGITQLKTLLQLQYLNVTRTKVSANGLQQLSQLKNLQQLFLYKTNFTSSTYINLKKIFPNAIIDTGGYKTEMLQTDTMLVKPPLGN